jgi:photosystem II stability/assembly factor-like uncharacterized protein
VIPRSATPTVSGQRGDPPDGVVARRFRTHALTLVLVMIVASTTASGVLGSNQASASCGSAGSKTVANGHWSLVNRLSGYEGEDVAFMTSCFGIVTGVRLSAMARGVILRTTDGGHSFRGVVIPGAGTDVRSVSLSGNYGAAVGSTARGGLVLVPRDQGRTWVDVTPPSAKRGGYMRAVALSGRHDIWAAAGPILYSTTTFGQRWTAKTVAPLVSYISAVAFLDATRGVLVGSKQQHPVVLLTSNGGKSWTAVYSTKQDGALFQLVLTPRCGWAVGSTRAGDAVILRTSGSLTHWEAVSLPPLQSAVGVWCKSPQIAQVAGASRTRGVIVGTSDAGRRWSTNLSGINVGPGPFSSVGNQSWMIGSYGLFEAGAS